MKFWIDNSNPAPEGYTWLKSVQAAKAMIHKCEYMKSFFSSKNYWDIELVDIGYSAGFYAQFGGDYIKFLDWLEETGRDYPIRIHSQNSAEIQEMRAIIQRNGWTEIK